MTSDSSLPPAFRAWLAAAFLAMVPIAPATASDRGTDLPEIGPVFERWNRTNAAGIAVVITLDGRIVRQATYGLANLEHRIPVTTDTVFDAASVAKQFAGFAVGTLVQQGAISLSDDVRQHLPDVPDFGRTITLDHLAHHTSGLRDWPETLLLSGRSWSDRIDMEVILEMLSRQRDLDFPPGTEYSYSNTGYNLLARVVEKVSGMSFSEWTRRHIFEPLGMVNTRFVDDPDGIVADRAESYMPGDHGEWRKVPSRLAAVGSSSLFTTIDDMARWLINLDSAAVGGRSVLSAMAESGSVASGRAADYGLGLAIGRHRGMRLLQHTGGWAGYRSIVQFLPEQRFGLAILSNAGRVNTTELARQITDLFFPPPAGGAEDRADRSESPASAGSSGPAAEPEESPDPARWEVFTGRFRLGPGWILNITREGDRMFTRATGEDRFPMRHVAGNRFFVEGYGSSITFLPGESGAVNRLRYRGIVAPRIHSPDLDPGKLREFAGEYWSDELRVMVRVESHDGELRMWHPSRDWSALAPVETDEFEGDGRLVLRFARSDSGVVEGLRVSASRVRNLEFRKVSLRTAN